jgi:hypothetical protein
LRINSDADGVITHFIQMKFFLPNGFDGGQTVAEIRSLDLSDTPGDNLAIPSGPPIVPNHFLASFARSAKTRNLAQLENGRHFDIGVTYESGRQAVISLDYPPSLYAEVSAAWASAGVVGVLN